MESGRGLCYSIEGITLMGSKKVMHLNHLCWQTVGSDLKHPQTVNQGQSIFGAHPLQGCGDRSWCRVLI